MDPKSRRGSVAAMAVLAVAAVALAVVPPALMPPDETSSVAPVPSASTTPSISFPSSPYRSIEWTTYSPANLKGSTVLDLVAFGDRLVAVGRHGSNPAAWFSDDGGVSWERAALDAAVDPDGAYPLPRRVGASAHGLAAQGLIVDPDGSVGILRPVGWTSADGERWTQQRGDPSMGGTHVVQLIGTDGGFMALAMDPRGAVELYRSANGGVWESAEATGLDSVEPNAGLLRSSETYLIGGGTRAGSRSWPVILAAKDDLAFDASLRETELFGSVATVTWGPFGFVAAGHTYADLAHPEMAQGTIWISRDGRSWAALQLAEKPAGTVAVGAANATGAAFVVSTDSSSEIWFLPGGSGEARVATIPIAVDRVVALADRFVAVGWCTPSGACEGSMVAVGRPST